MKLDNGLLVREDTKGRHGGVHTLWYLHFQGISAQIFIPCSIFMGIFTVGNVAEFLSIALHKTRLMKKQMRIWPREVTDLKRFRIFFTGDHLANSCHEATQT